MRTLACLIALAAFAAHAAETDATATAQVKNRDPNHVHAHADSGLGTGGVDMGVAAKTPTTVTILPLAQVPTPTRIASFSSWHGHANVGPHTDHSDTDGDWTTTEAGWLSAPTPDFPRVQPWSQLDMSVPQACSAVVLVNGCTRDDATIAMAGTVTINDGAPLPVSGWASGTALVVPVKAGVRVARVHYESRVVPGGDSSGVLRIWLWR